MTALILALIALGTLFGLIVRAAKKAPQEYVDQIVRDQIEAAEAFDKGLNQGLKEDNTND